MTCNTENTGTGLTVVPVSAVDGLLTVSNAGLTSTLTLTMPNASMHHYHLWLSDSATDPTQTTTQPSGTILTEWEGETDSGGTATITITHNGASHTWYAFGWFTQVSTSVAITAGT